MLAGAYCDFPIQRVASRGAYSNVTRMLLVLKVVRSITQDSSPNPVSFRVHLEGISSRIQNTIGKTLFDETTRGCPASPLVMHVALLALAKTKLLMCVCLVHRTSEGEA